jgi:hypothetical protein
MRGPKNVVIAYVLGVLLGLLGAHHFYLGTRNHLIAGAAYIVAVLLVFLVITEVWFLLTILLVFVADLATLWLQVKKLNEARAGRKVGY